MRKVGVKGLFSYVFDKNLSERHLVTTDTTFYLTRLSGQSGTSDFCVVRSHSRMDSY